MNRFHYKILSVFIISLSLFTFPTNAKEYSSEIGTLWNFTVSKQINRINLQIQQNVWTLGKYYERYMPIAVVSYTAVPKYLKLNALYYYMNQQTAPNIYKNRHRYQLGATFSYPVHRFSLSLNSRFESTYTIGTAKPTNKYRIDKKNSIECKVREEHLMSKTPQQLNTFISLGYKLKL